MSKTIRRISRINYVGEDADPQTSFDFMDDDIPNRKRIDSEETKARKRKTALDWYNNHKSDEEFMEKRRQYANEYYQRKKRNNLRKLAMTKVKRAPINVVEELPVKVSLDEKLKDRKEKFIKKALGRKNYKLMKKSQLSEENV